MTGAAASDGAEPCLLEVSIADELRLGVAIMLGVVDLRAADNRCCKFLSGPVVVASLSTLLDGVPDDVF